MKTFRECLGNQVLFFDGGTGSVLQAQGLLPGELPENWNVEQPEKIVQLGYGYYLAGSNIINTNTFGAFVTKFTGQDGKYSVGQVIDAAFKNAEKARSMIIQKEKEDGIESVPRFIAFDIRFDPHRNNERSV